MLTMAHELYGYEVADHLGARGHALVRMVSLLYMRSYYDGPEFRAAGH